MNELTTGESGHNTNDIECIADQEARDDLRQECEQFSNATTSDRTTLQ